MNPTSPRFHPNGAAALVRMARGEPDPLAVSPPGQVVVDTGSSIQEVVPTTTLDAQLLAQGIPLAGDLVALATQLMGADRFAKWLAAKLGTDCGCAERQRRLNEIDRLLRKYLSLFKRRWLIPD